MKKVLLVLSLFFILYDFSNGYIGVCNEMKLSRLINGEKTHKCTSTFYISGLNNIKKETGEIIFKNDKNVKFKSIYENVDIKLIETKYGKHIFNTLEPKLYRDPLYLTKNKTLNKYYEEYNDYIKENKKYFGLYLDGQKVLNYGIDGEKTDYNSLKDFFQKNNIVSYGDDGEVYVDGSDVTFTIYGTMKGELGNIVLKESTINKLDKFLLKVEKGSYSQEKLFKKVDSLYNKFNLLNDRKSKIIAEILLYIRTELLIKKIKKSGEIKTVDFYVDFE